MQTIRTRKPVPALQQITRKPGLTRWERLLLGLDLKNSLQSLTWASITPLSSPQYHGVAVNLRKRIWVLGGFHQDGSIADIEIFDPAQSGWSIVPYPFTYFGQSIVVSNEKLYAIGGVQGCHTLTNHVEQYDPESGLLKQMAPLPMVCYAPGATSTPEGKIYVMGGCLPPSDPGGPPSAFLKTVQIYDTLTNTWAMGPPMTVSRYQSSAVRAADGRIYLIGGSDGNTELTRVDVFDPSTNTWQTMAAPMPTARRCLASVLASDNKIYAIGGLGEYDWALPTVEVFDPASNAWTTSTPLGVGRWYLGAAAASDKIYAFGGYVRIGNYQPGNANVIALATVEEGLIQ